MTQVIIVGAGPAGATLAYLFTRRGIAVTLIEASPTFRRSFRGEGLMPSGLDALQQMGLASMLDRIPHRALDAWEFWLNQRLLFRVEEPIEPQGQPCTLVSQSALLQALIEQTSTSPQFEFIQGIAVQDVLWQEQRVAGVKLNDGRELHGDITIATDGRNSIVRQRANLAMQHFSRNFDILWFQLPDHPRFEHENVFYSILQDRHAFGVFRSSEGNLQLGWALREPDAIDWQQINWAKRLTAAAPDWLADHCRTHADSLDRPVLLSVVVGRCPQWWVPGLLLLGDAAHPMSPIRAQGINMALRDVIVTANYLVPCLQQSATPEAIDAVLSKIQVEREPEIIRAQQLQRAEAAQADQLEHSALLRWGASQFAAVIRQPVRQSWIYRQRQLRQGVTTVQLKV